MADRLRWTPTPFTQFVVKLTSRCDLACDYCYVFGDDTWRTLPRIMPAEVLATTATRIAEHAERHATPVVRVVLHGGEPLLAGVDRLDEVATVLQTTVERSGTALRLSVQTNGVLLDEPVLAVLRRHRIRVGVSLDGTAEMHDRHRRRRDGRGSHGPVTRALALLQRTENREVYGGLLCVVNPRTDPVACFEALIEHRPPRLDFLLPHGTWTAPPPLRTPGDPATPYADWLVAVFDRWYEAPAKETAIRLFESVMSQLLGAGSQVESLGLEPVDLICVGTDGAIEQVDSLKVVSPHAAATGLAVLDNDFDDALVHPGVVARQRGIAALGATCVECPIVAVCGGGLYSHRYRDGRFDYPSVYCPDLFALISHIRQRMDADLVALARR